MIPRTALAAVILCFAVTTQAMADRAEKLKQLSASLGLTEIIAIMRDEGLQHGVDIADQMLSGRTGSGWTRAVSDIYDADMMKATVEASLETGLDGVDIDPLLEFFVSDRGKRIIGFEVSARRALMDDDIEDAARETYARMKEDGDERLELIRQFVEANDLVASNVMGAMNSNYAFYLGLADGDALPSSMTEGDILSEVWSQEDEIRADTEAWVYSYLAMAYKPLEDADLEAYIAISQTKEGQALNRALFDGFDVMYNAISRSMGAAAAREISSQDI